MKSIVKVQDIWLEDLFKWYYNHVGDSGGDGAGIIICKDPKECSTYFYDYLGKVAQSIKIPNYLNFLKKDEQIRDGYIYITYHDTNESFIFTNDRNAALGHGDYTFIVIEKCISIDGKRTVYEA